MRGTKLTAWQIPPVWNDLQKGILATVEDSTVLQKQEKLLRATREVLLSIVKDVQKGLLETVGIESEFSIDDGRCSIILILPESADTDMVARAIDAENVEAWRDGENRVHVGVNPWYSTKDVDQTVLSTTKVVHVLLGLHASDSMKPKTFGQKLLAMIAEVLLVEKKASRKTN